MINVLHIMGCSDIGGISTVVYNLYSHIDRTQIHFDILLTVPTEGINTNKLRDLGCKIYHTATKSFDFTKFKNDLVELIKDGYYNAVHVHENQTSYVALKIAKKYGIKCRIAHSHTSSPYFGIINEIKRLSGCIFNNIYATDLLACGKLAGKRVFGTFPIKNKFHLLYNGIELNKFRFNPEKRNLFRTEIQANNKPVIGFVGRLSEEKNIFFALNVIKLLKQQTYEFMFVIIGDGELKEKIQQEITDSKLSANVLMLGRRTDVDVIYSGLDMLLLPSFHEGFPVTLVEATASNLPCLISNRISTEFLPFDNIEYKPIDEPQCWVSSIDKLKIVSMRSLEIPACLESFDIENVVAVLQKIYTERLR